MVQALPSSLEVLFVAGVAGEVLDEFDLGGARA
jgi:hypothetical protein